MVRFFTLGAAACVGRALSLGLALASAEATAVGVAGAASEVVTVPADPQPPITSKPLAASATLTTILTIPPRAALPRKASGQ
jgi:hypothetical protein